MIRRELTPCDHRSKADTGITSVSSGVKHATSAEHRLSHPRPISSSQSAAAATSSSLLRGSHKQGNRVHPAELSISGLSPVPSCRSSPMQLYGLIRPFGTAFEHPDTIVAPARLKDVTRCTAVDRRARVHRQGGRAKVWSWRPRSGSLDCYANWEAHLARGR